MLYRASKPKILEAPGRIFWYVSKSQSRRSFPNEMCIKACSMLDEVVIDDPMSLYRKFRRYGAYQKEDIHKSAQSDSSKQAMAVRFSDTLPAVCPIPLQKIREILDSPKIVFQTAYRVTKLQFKELYEYGFNS
jgi:hypothetical protein